MQAGCLRYECPVRRVCGPDTTAVGPAGHLCTFTTGSSGELHLLLDMWWSDEARRNTVYMPARGRFLVSRE